MVASQSRLLLFEALDLIGNTTILGAVYGIIFVLYCLCARSLYTQLHEPDKRNQARFTLVYISLLFFWMTAFVVLNAWMVQLVYIKHPNVLDGLVTGRYARPQNAAVRPYTAANSLLELAITTMTMAIQIWRVRIIWSGGRYSRAVTIVPLLLLFTYIVLIFLLNILPSFISLDWLVMQTFASLAVTRYAVLSALSILVTGLVIGRILLIRRKCVKLIGASNRLQVPYVSVAMMLIESFALESVWCIVTTILAGLQSTPFSLFTQNDPGIKVIAYLLVVYRVANKRGWTSETGRELTNLQWGHGIQTTVDEPMTFAQK